MMNDELTQQERSLLDLLASINKMEAHCKKVDTIEAVPPEAYKLISKLRDVIAKWGIQCIEKCRHIDGSTR